MIINPYLVQPSIPAFTGLLDTYTGAAVAYSAARRLSSTYTGALIRVRRSSDNAEQDIGYDGSNVLDESALTTFVGANNGFVTTWYDQSGNGLNVTQSTAANQPKIVSSGVVEKDNGKAKLTFDGTNDFLDGGDILKIGNNPLYGFMVAKGASSGTFYAKTKFAAANSRYAFWNPSGTSLTIIDSAGSDCSVSGTLQTNKKLFNQLYFFNNITTVKTSQIYVDNTSLASTNIGNLTGIGDSTNNFLIGKYNDASGGSTGTNYQLNGFQQELVIYLSDQSANLSAINGNINTFYTIY